MGFFLSFEGEGHGIKKCGIKSYLFFLGRTVLGWRESFSLCLSVYVYLHLLSVKRLDKNISNSIFLVNLFYFWFLSGQSYNYLLGSIKKL